METTSQTPRTDAQFNGREYLPAEPLVTASFARQLEAELNDAKAGNDELLERLRERTESHLAASARDIQDNQRLRVENEAMRDAIKEAQSAVSAFLGFHSDHLSNAQVASLSETLTKLQPFIKP